MAAEFAVLLAIGAIQGWLGSYGSYGCLGLPDRFAFWMVGRLLVGLVCLAALRLMIRDRIDRVVAADATRAGWRVHCKPAKRDDRLRARDGFPPRPTSPLEIADLYGWVMIVTAVVGLPLHFMRTPMARARSLLCRSAPERPPRKT
jgi:hypothetical protein